MSDIFRFKQFSVDQSGCAMKINTDGVLLGALVDADNPQTILDIGTGTGVIALMLAQKFAHVAIDAVEIDKTAAETAAANFNNSPFKEQLTIYSESFTDFFGHFPEKKYDLIASNPPFHLHSLKSTRTNRSLAKHANADFFLSLILSVVKHLSAKGLCWLVLPLQTAALVKELAMQNGLYLHKIIKIYSFKDTEPHREIICLGLEKVSIETSKFTIYKSTNIYSEDYKNLLQPYFIAF